MKLMETENESPIDVDYDSVLSFTNSIKICPLCNSQLKFFFLNLTEKFLMCENTDCEYPFGHTDLKFVKLGNGDDDLSSVTSRSTSQISTACSSIVSNVAWGDIERMNRIYDSDDQLENQSLCSSTDRDNVLLKSQQLKESENILKKNIDDIKELSVELKRVETDCPPIIHNKKWIKNLMRVQKLSGVKLLAEEEMHKLQKPSEPNLGLGELTIDIAPKDDQMSCIRIEISNKGSETNSSVNPK